jgi:prepilin-type N-terminal cleavage/methylation domain-containing protein
MKTNSKKQRSLKAICAFSLIELLAVMAIIGILAALTITVFSGSGQDMSRAANTVMDVMQQARTHAMSKNTYVYVGFSETDQPDQALAVAVLEAGDGLASRFNDLAASGGDSRLRPVRKLTFLPGVILDTSTAQSNLPDDSLPSSSALRIEELESSRISFPAGLVTGQGTIVDARFDWVVQFGPDGAVRLDATARTVPDYILLGLIPSRGEPTNSVAVAIDGTSGAIRLVRPGA